MDIKYVELFKPVAYAVSAIIIVFFLKTMGLDLSQISEISSSGIKLKEQRIDNLNALGELADKVKNIESRMDTFASNYLDSREKSERDVRDLVSRLKEVRVLAMKAHPTEKSLPTAARPSQNATAPDARGPDGASIPDREDTVPDPFAQMAFTVKGGKATIYKDKQGYMFVGRTENDRMDWKSLVLSAGTGQPPKTVGELHVGSSYSLKENMVVRALLPTKDNGYYTKIERVGIVPRGNTVTLVSAPAPVVLSGGTDYWAMVKVDQ